MKKKSNSVETDIRKIIADILQIEPEKIAPDAKFIDDLGMDSMMALEIVAAVEKKYRIAIPEDQLMKMGTLKDVVEIAKQFIK